MKLKRELVFEERIDPIVKDDLVVRFLYSKIYIPRIRVIQKKGKKLLLDDVATPLEDYTADMVKPHQFKELIRGVIVAFPELKDLLKNVKKW